MKTNKKSLNENFTYFLSLESCRTIDFNVLQNIAIYGTRLPAENPVVYYSITQLPAKNTAVCCGETRLPTKATVVYCRTTQLPAEAICSIL